MSVSSDGGWRCMNLEIFLEQNIKEWMAERLRRLLKAQVPSGAGVRVPLHSILFCSFSIYFFLFFWIRQKIFQKQQASLAQWQSNRLVSGRSAVQSRQEAAFFLLLPLVFLGCLFLFFLCFIRWFVQLFS